MFNVFTRLPGFIRNLRTIVCDSLSFFAGVWRHHTALAAENLLLRKQLALSREREKKAMPTTPADRFVFSKLARWFDWRSALLIVKPATLIGWHRNAFRLFWRWKSRPVGRPPVTAEVRDLIRRLAAENPTWGEQRIADELWLKLQIRLSPRTVAKYSKQRPRPRGSRDQRWSTFLKNHSNAIAACDCFTVVTVCFRVVYVFVALEIGSRRLIHFNATEHPTAEWTLQQLREALPEIENTGFCCTTDTRPSLLLWTRRLRAGVSNLEIPRACADRECFLQTSNRKHPSRVFGLCDTAE